MYAALPTQPGRAQLILAERAGNSSWEQELAKDYGPNSTVDRCKPNDPQHLVQLEERQIANRQVGVLLSNHPSHGD